MYVIKRNGSKEKFNPQKIENAVLKAYKACGLECDKTKQLHNYCENLGKVPKEEWTVEEIQNAVERALIEYFNYKVGKAYMLYREQHKTTREFVEKKKSFINRYKDSNNTANATVDDNSNVGGKNIGILNAEIHKEDNIQINRGMVVSKLKELYPDFDAKWYIRDLENHVIYKHDESGFAGAISPYCCSISMYPFLTGGIKEIGGLSAAPQNIDSYCGMFVNLIFAVSAQFAGAVATSEALLYFDYFARKEWGDEYYLKPDAIISTDYCNRKKTIKSQIHQYFQQIIYSINQPAAARGMQSAFVNFSLFDRNFFEGMFGNFYFPDGTKPQWKSLNWLQKDFLHWFNQERLRCILTFPVVSCTLLYKDNEFKDKEFYEFICEEYAQGNSFFLYISDTVDSLSSCCFSKDTKVLWKNSFDGVRCTTFEELHNIKWEPYKRNLKVYHNGSWVSARSIKLPNKKMFKVTTQNNKEFIMSDNHINLTYRGEIQTAELTTDDYLMFNTKPLETCKENDEHLTYEQGLLVGMFIGDGSFGNYVCKDGSIHEFNLSLNKDKYEKALPYLSKICEVQLSAQYNNVYPVRICNKELVAFLMRWTGNKPGETYAYNKKLNINCILQSKEFRQGILDGWYLTDGGNSNRCYTISKQLVEDMEILITSLGKQCVIDVNDRTDETVIIREQEYNRNYPLYCIRWYSDTNSRIRPESGFKWKNNSIYWKISSIEEVENNDDIYCFEMRNQDEPYFTLPSGLITHNCRLKNKIQTKEFNFTNGNMGVETGSKSVISLNLNRIIQDFHNNWKQGGDKKLLNLEWTNEPAMRKAFTEYLGKILERVYKYQTAYNELLWDMYNAGLLPVYNAGFIDLNKQYLTIGLIGTSAAAEYLGIEISDNPEYQEFCQTVFSFIKEQNAIHKTKKTTWNTEQVPSESAAIKLYDADKKDGYWVPEDINLYTSYVFKPYDKDLPFMDRIVLHGKNYIGDYLDGGSAVHLNLEEHLDKEQYMKILKFAAENGCSYLTFNVPNSECEDCGYITKVPIIECPKCGSKKIALYDRIIGYLTKIANWSKGRQIEQKKRIYSKNIC